MDNSEISENHLKAIVGWLQVLGAAEFSPVPIYRQGNRGAKGKRRKVAIEAGSWSGECQLHLLAWARISVLSRWSFPPAAVAGDPCRSEGATGRGSLSLGGADRCLGQRV